jgi:pimeloyl-ACP methyl ester carboxylesterase
MEPRGFVHGARPGAPASTPRSQSSDDGAAPAPVPRDARPLPVVTADGVPLSALVYGSPDAEVAVVFGHGFTGTQRNPKVVGLARELADTGLAVYTTDFRGHGASAGRSTFGVREVYDLDAVVAGLERDTPGSSRPAPRWAASSPCATSPSAERSTRLSLSAVRPSGRFRDFPALVS